MSSISPSGRSTCSDSVLDGKYGLYESVGENEFRAESLHSGKQLVCKVFPISRYIQSMSVYSHLPVHPNLDHPAEIILGPLTAYVFFDQPYGDMRSHIQISGSLGEDVAAKLFYQMVSAVAHCHSHDVVLFQMSLRKFAFRNKERTHLALFPLVDAYTIDTSGSVSRKQRCQVYASPESLQTESKYSGKASDVWSLGVMLYTILVGRYPFRDPDLRSLFSKIQRCKFNLPEKLSPKAKCLICSVLRLNPSERLTAEEILIHPWFSSADFSQYMWRRKFYQEDDQRVPDHYS